MLENQVFDGSEVVVVAAGKRGFPAMKFMIFDVFLMCILWLKRCSLVWSKSGKNRLPKRLKN